jgi:hypothetical protein
MPHISFNGDHMSPSSLSALINITQPTTTGAGVGRRRLLSSVGISTFSPHHSEARLLPTRATGVGGTFMAQRKCLSSSVHSSSAVESTQPPQASTTTVTVVGEKKMAANIAKEGQESETQMASLSESADFAAETGSLADKLHESEAAKSREYLKEMRAILVKQKPSGRKRKVSSLIGKVVSASVLKRGRRRHDALGFY